MILSIPNVLTPEELQVITSSLNETDFVDGKTTAGWHAKVVKHNFQLKSEATYAKDLKDLVKAALKRHAVFQMAVLPRVIHSMLFSRHEAGMSYGRHSTYEGGELVIESTDAEQAYKLEAGSVIVYPSSTLHRVEPVTEGVRLVAVGWVQSLVREPSEREILFDLDTTRRAIFTKQGKTIEFDLISKSHANLLRKWAE